MEDFFRQLADDAPRWNFIWMYEDRQQGKILAGLWMTIKLSILCLIFSVIIGLVGYYTWTVPPVFEASSSPSLTASMFIENSFIVELPV